MLKGIPILFTWLFLGVWASPASSPVLFRVSSPLEGRGVIVRPYVAPYLNLLEPKDERMDMRPGDILSCAQGQFTRDFDDHHDNFVTFDCTLGDSGKGKHITLTLDGLRFADEYDGQGSK